jgi:hypothetical protein
MKCCLIHKISGVLVLVGAVNWGLVGLGALVSGSDWNLVHMLLGQWVTLEAIVYLLVGLSGVSMIFMCSCKECKKAK